MSRKPTAVSLSKADTTDATRSAKKPAKPKAETKPVTKTTRKPEKASGSSRREPRAMKPPKQEETLETGNAMAAPGLPNHLPVAKKRGRWGVLFFSSISALLMLGLGLWFIQVIESLFARHEWLGWGASVLLAIVVVSLVVFILREIIALWQLRKLAGLREDIVRVLDDRSAPGSRALDKLANLYTEREDMHWHLSRLASHKDDVIDDRDRLALAERYLMKPLDDEAKQVITSAAKRISVVTAVNPAPALDIIFTGYQVLKMLRHLTSLYGNRPGSIGTLKLAGMVGSHLAVTGGLALSDTFIQQFLGKGLAGRLSAKLGEGTVNGIMTARIGIAALELCRPMPFREVSRPGLKEFISTIAGSIRGADHTKPDELA